MPNDREKLLHVMRNLDSDYKSGKISAEKYSYFRSKYEDKLNSIDAEAATRKIRSMQGKPSTNTQKKKSNRKRSSKPANNKRNEEQDLVQKYIINPKKGDKQYNKKQKNPVDSGTFKLIVVLVLVIGFTAGIAYGIFNFDYDTVTDTNSVAIVEDTAFPVIHEVIKTNTTDTDDDNATVDDVEEEEVEIVTYEEVEEDTNNNHNTPQDNTNNNNNNNNQGGGSQQSGSNQGSQSNSEE